MDLFVDCYMIALVCPPNFPFVSDVISALFLTYFIYDWLRGRVLLWHSFLRMYFSLCLILCCSCMLLSIVFGSIWYVCMIAAYYTMGSSFPSVFDGYEASNLISGLVIIVFFLLLAPYTGVIWVLGVVVVTIIILCVNLLYILPTF